MNKIETLKALIEKSEGDERAKYQDELVKAIQEDAEVKAQAKVDEKVREELAKNTTENVEIKGKIEVGTPGTYKGVKIKKVMASLGQMNEKDPHRDDTDAAEFAAAFWIDKAIEAQNLVGKANELVTTTDSVGGYLTPIEQEKAILAYAAPHSIALQDAQVIPMTSDVMTIPVRSTLGSVTIESAETSITQATPTWGQATLTAKRHSAYVPVSWELQMDDASGLAADLAGQFYEDLGLTIDSAVFCGPGSLVDGSGVMLAYGVSAVMATGSTNFSSVYTSMFHETVGKLYPERRVGAKWYMQYDNLWSYVRPLTALSSGSDVPLFDVYSNKIDGFGVRELRQGVATAASKPLAVLGNLKNFKIGSRLMNMGLKKIEEKTGMTDFVFFTRLAYSNPLPNAFAGLQTGAAS